MTPADFSAIFAQSHRRTIDPRFLAKRVELFAIHRPTAALNAAPAATAESASLMQGRAGAGDTM